MLETLPWYNCLTWAFSQVLGVQLPYCYGKYILNWRLPIEEAFCKKASELGVKVMQLDSLERLHEFKYGFLVYGYFLEEICEGNYTDYQYSGFHVVLCRRNRLFHQNGCGVMPTATSMEELQVCGYTKPLYFAVTGMKEQD